MIEQLPLSPDAIADLVHTVVAAGVGGWSLGVQGAVADLSFGDADPLSRTSRSGRTIETIVHGGGLRLRITDDVWAFAQRDVPGSCRVLALFLTVPRRSLPEPADRVTVTAGDGDALRDEDRGSWLIDLGVGHSAVRFCVRTDDTALVDRLRKVEGATWRDALAEAGAAIVARSPHRVLITPLGRAEVYSPIPPPGGQSPEGPHTHLLPAELDGGRELPVGVVLPPDLAVAATFHPHPGWTLPDA